ncbi:unannotated protein [freshwater metagenome]|uniref:Unannotated protein n=1 Tax=freshwater metagenome TaxID=449393 RepID=A0A6J7HUL7_9ZZZZ
MANGDGSRCRAGSARKIDPDALDRCEHDRLMAAIERHAVCAQAEPRDVRLEVRKGVDKHRPELVLEGHRGADRFERADEVNARLKHARIGREAIAAVVIAGGDDDRDPRLGQGVDRSVQESKGFDGRNRSIEDITCDDDAIDGLRHREVDDESDRLLLGRLQRQRVEGTAEVPIRGVEQSHADPPTLVSATRSLRAGLTRAR